jgi:ABC-type transport system, involved in lipoprotein release, permease component
MATMTLPRRINKNTSLQAALPAIEINRLFTLAAGFSQLLQGLGLLILLLALVSVFAALLQSFRDEEPQLAYLRVLGARPSHLFVLILSKGLSLCALGYLAGMLLSQLGLFALGRFLSNQYHYQLSSQLLTAENLWLLAGTLLLGFVAALWPAWRAFRLNISDTLTHA